MNLSFREWVRLAGIVILATGLMCLPLGAIYNPKAAQSAFVEVTALGGFLKIGINCIFLGGIIVGLSYYQGGKKKK